MEKVTVCRAVPIDGDDFIEVEFEGEPRIENDGIGSYEYWGSVEYDKGYNYATMEGCEITWDKELFTIEENIIIENYLNSGLNWLNIAEEMERKY